MAVKYAKPVSILFIILGVALVGIGFMLMSMTGEFQIGMVTGAIIGLFGILSLNNPLLVLENGEVQLRNLFGMTLKRYPVSTVRVETDTNGIPRLVTPKPNGRNKTLLKGKSFFFDSAASMALINAVQGSAFD